MTATIAHALPAPRAPTRARSGITRALILTVAAGVGVYLLVREASMLGTAITAITSANPVGLVLTAVLGATTYVAAAVAITAASGRRLSLGRTTAVQLAAACTNRITPAGLGGMATNVRHLEHDGATRSQAVTAVGVTSVASFVVHTITTIGVLAVVHRPTAVSILTLPPVPSWPTMLLGTLITGFVGRVLIRRFGPRIRLAARDAWTGIAAVCIDRRRLARLLVGTIGVTFGHGLAFATAVTACGVQLPLVALLAVFLSGSAIGATAPTPGGLGALEAAFVAGLTALGTPIAAAIAGVLTYRLITYWLPIIPGAIALKWVRSHDRAPECSSSTSLAASQTGLGSNPPRRADGADRSVPQAVVAFTVLSHTNPHTGVSRPDEIVGPRCPTASSLRDFERILHEESLRSPARDTRCLGGDGRCGAGCLARDRALRSASATYALASVLATTEARTGRAGRYREDPARRRDHAREPLVRPLLRDLSRSRRDPDGERRADGVFAGPEVRRVRPPIPRPEPLECGRTALTA